MGPADYGTIACQLKRGNSIPAASGKTIARAKPSINQAWRRRLRCPCLDIAPVLDCGLVFTLRLRVLGFLATTVEVTANLRCLQVFCNLRLCAGCFVCSPLLLRVARCKAAPKG